MDEIKNKIHKFTEDTLDFLYKWNPVLATDLGIHKYDEELGDFSPPSVSKFTFEARQRINELEEIKNLAVDGQAKDECLLLKQMLKINLFNLEKAQFLERNPHFYVDQVLHGIFLLLLRKFAPVEERVRLVEKRLNRVGDFLQESKKNLTSPGKVSTEVAIETAEFSEIFLDEISQNFPFLSKSVGEVKKALNNYVAWLKNVLPETEANFAIGKELYEEKLKTHHFLNLTTDEMLKIAEEEFKKVEEDLNKIAREIDPSKSWLEIYQKMQEEHPAADKLLDAYKEETKKIKEFIKENDLVDLPEKETLKIEETPVFLRTLAPFAVYFTPAPFEEDQTAYFYVTPVDKSLSPEEQEDVLKGHNLYEIPLICLHEAYPGHHLQLINLGQSESKVVKKWGCIYNLFLSEGWAVYCEELFGEFGCANNPYLKLSQLRFKIWYVIRTLLDIKLHLQQITFDEAVGFLASELNVDKFSAEAEIRRSAVDATTLACYFNGMYWIKNLRKRYSASDKPEFLNLKCFHQEILRNSNFPLPLLKERLLT